MWQGLTGGRRPTYWGCGGGSPHREAEGRLIPKPLFWLIFQGFKAREPFQRLRTQIMFLVGGLSAHCVRTVNFGPLFCILFYTFETFLEKVVGNNDKVQQKTTFWWKPKLVPFQFCAGCTEYQIQGTLVWWFRGHLNFHGLGVFGSCLARSTASNLCARWLRTLRGWFFAQNSVLKMRGSGFPGF